MESLLSFQPSKIFAASRFARKRVQVEKVKHRLVPLDKSTFLGPILITVLFLTISIIFDFSFAHAVNQAPTASFTLNLTSGEAPLNVNFDATASNDPEGTTLSYDWAFGDHETGLGSTTSHEYKSAGTYTVTLMVTDNDGATDTATAKITVTKRAPPSEVEEIQKRLNILEDVRKPKMVRPNKEVEFLFDSIVGSSYSPEYCPKDSSDNFKFQGRHPILKLWVPRFSLTTRATYKSKLVNNLPKIDDALIKNAGKTEGKEKPYIVDYVKKRLYELSEKSDLFEKSEAEDIVKFFEEALLKEEQPLSSKIVTDCLEDATKKARPDCEIEKEVELSDSQAMEYKMQAIEKVLDLKSEGKIIERIDSAHTEIRNYEWAHDYLRFGILVNHIPGINANATSVALNAYPTYRRFMPGNLDLGRRMSLFFAGGTASTAGETEAKGIVYSYGFGLDIIRGVGLAIGMSTYSVRQLGTEDYKTENSLSLGICLSSELWKGLFGK